MDNSRLHCGQSCRQAGCRSKWPSLSIRTRNFPAPARRKICEYHAGVCNKRVGGSFPARARRFGYPQSAGHLKRRESAFLFFPIWVGVDSPRLIPGQVLAQFSLNVAKNPSPIVQPNLGDRLGSERRVTPPLTIDIGPDDHQNRRYYGGYPGRIGDNARFLVF